MFGLLFQKLDCHCQQKHIGYRYSWGKKCLSLLFGLALRPNVEKQGLANHVLFMLFCWIWRANANTVNVILNCCLMYSFNTYANNFVEPLKFKVVMLCQLVFEGMLRSWAPALKHRFSSVNVAVQVFYLLCDHRGPHRTWYNNYMVHVAYSVVRPYAA